VDYMLNLILCLLDVLIPVLWAIMETSHPRRRPKQGLYKKTHYIPRLTEKSIGLCSSVEQVI
jgi:hypothetical protein